MVSSWDWYLANQMQYLDNPYGGMRYYQSPSSGGGGGFTEGNPPQQASGGGAGGFGGNPNPGPDPLAIPYADNYQVSAQPIYGRPEPQYSPRKAVPYQTDYDEASYITPIPTSNYEPYEPYRQNYPSPSQQPRTRYGEY